MAWYRVKAEIEIEVEALTEDQAKLHAETIISKRVVGQEFGHEKNDRGSVTDNWSIVGMEQDDE